MANGAGLEARNVAGAITSMGVGELISKLAIGIAEGQLELDSVCMQIAQFMGDAQVARGGAAVLSHAILQCGLYEQLFLGYL